MSYKCRECGVMVHDAGHGAAVCIQVLREKLTEMRAQYINERTAHGVTRDKAKALLVHNTRLVLALDVAHAEDRLEPVGADEC